MIGLPRKVGRNVVVLILFESAVAQVAPENRGHSKLVGLRESLADFDDLSSALVGAEINGCADSGRAHVIRLLYRTKQHLVESIGKREQFVVINLHNERNLVRVLASHGAEHTERRSDSVAAAFDGQLDDVFAIEIVWVFREAGAAGMLDTLIH